MDPVRRIKDHIVALNSVSYDDDVHLELYLSQLKETLCQIFGVHSQYLTYLNSIRFHPISPVVPVEDSIRCWARGKKQVRDLLFVILDDSALKECESWDERELGEEAVVEVATAERIIANAERRADLSRKGEINSSLIDVIRAFKNKARIDMSAAHEMNDRVLEEERQARASDMPRVRIDLRHLDLLNDGVETYLVHKASFLPKDSAKKVLFVPSSDPRQNQKVRGFFSVTEAILVEETERSLVEKQFSYQANWDPSIQMAIVVLSGHHWVSWTEETSQRTSWVLSPSSCFQLGYLVSKLGPRRVIALYEESPEFRRPTGYFELIYISMTPSGVWRNDLAQYLKENKVAVKDEAHPFFYAA